MKSLERAAPALALLGTLCFTAAGALGNPLPSEYGWTISDSPTNPYSNTGTTGVAILYLHCACSTAGGISSAEFDLAFANGLGSVAQFVPQSPFLNVGGPSNLLLIAPGCPYPPVLVGQLICVFSGPDELCIVPSVNGVSETVDCAGFPYPNTSVGYSATGAPPACDDRYPGATMLCWYIVSVDQNAWGTIKSLYR